MNARFSIAAVMVLGLGCTAAAQAAEPVDSVTANVAVVSDYLFRGLTQSWGRPALQGGVDHADPEGFAVGAWGSNISENSYPGGAMELDLYASYGTSIGGNWSWRMGMYGYVYPGANLDHAGLPSRSMDTLEANAALGWKRFTLKYNRSLTDYFGADTTQGYRGDTRGTDYLQLDAAFPWGEAWSLALHAGHTRYGATLAAPLASGAHDPSYSDFSAALKYQYAPHWSVSGGVSHATHAAFYRRTASFLDAGQTRDVGGTRGFLIVQGTF